MNTWMRVLILVTMWLSLVVLFPKWSQAEMARYNVDVSHSTVAFEVAHMVISRTRGKFTEFSGFIEMDAESKKIKAIEATIQTASVDTNHPKRDQHLRSPDFFHVAQYPTMIYNMTSYRKTGDAYEAKGTLTLLGVTKDTILVGTFHGIITDPWGNVRAGFSGEGKVNRKDFGMAWSKLLDNTTPHSTVSLRGASSSGFV